MCAKVPACMPVTADSLCAVGAGRRRLATGMPLYKLRHESLLQNNGTGAGAHLRRSCRVHLFALKTSAGASQLPGAGIRTPRYSVTLG